MQESNYLLNKKKTDQKIKKKNGENKTISHPNSKKRNQPKKKGELSDYEKTCVFLVNIFWAIIKELDSTICFLSSKLRKFSKFVVIDNLLFHLLPDMYSEVNIRSLYRISGYVMVNMYMSTFTESMFKLFEPVFAPEAEECDTPRKYRTHSYIIGTTCLALGDNNLGLSLYYDGLTARFWGVIQCIILYLACIKGWRLKRKTFYKINLLFTLTSFIQTLFWRHIWRTLTYAVWVTRHHTYIRPDGAPEMFAGFFAQTCFWLHLLNFYIDLHQAIRSRSEWKFTGN